MTLSYVAISSFRVVSLDVALLSARLFASQPPDEGQQVGVELILVRGGQAVRRARVDLQRRRP